MPLLSPRVHRTPAEQGGPAFSAGEGKKIRHLGNHRRYHETKYFNHEHIRELYKRVFHAFGSKLFNVSEAADSTEATNRLIRHKVDIIILDINMPRVNGSVMCEIVKEYDPDIKVIISSVCPIHKQKELIPEASDYYDKSSGPVKLLEKVAHQMQ